jgi:hypothetical protein
MGRRCGRRPVEQDWSGLRGSNPAPGCFAVRGRDGGRPLTCDPDPPTLTARARRGPAVLMPCGPSTDQGARPPRAWEALFGRSLSGGGAGQGVRPLTGGDRCDRCGLLLSTTAAVFGVVGVVASDCDERAPGVGAATATSAGPGWDQVPAARPARPGAGGSPAHSTAPAARPLLRTQPPPAPTGTARARMTARKARATIARVTCRYQAW